MTVTQSAAVEAVRERLGEPSPGFYTDTEIRRWLNEGVREVARRAEWKRATESVDVDAAEQISALNSAVIRVYRVEWVQDNSNRTVRLEYRDINAMDSIWGDYQTSYGSPGWYTLINANPLSIELCPKPSSPGTLKVFYYAMPTDLATNAVTAASSNLDVPGGWEDLPIEWATALGWRKAGNTQQYQIAIQHFQSSLAALVEMAVRYTDEPAAITPDPWAWGYLNEEWDY